MGPDFCVPVSYSLHDPADVCLDRKYFISFHSISTRLSGSATNKGFEFIDLTSNDRSVLASITGKGPKVRKYFVNIAGCCFAAERLTNAIRNSDVIICDEIGPMELKSREFKDSVKSLVDVDKKVIVVVHQKLRHPLIDEFRNKSSLLINLDSENREKVNVILLDKLST